MVAAAPHPSTVLWTRGEGCGRLAELLADRPPLRVVGDLAEACLANRASLLVSKRLPSLDLVDVAVPLDFHPDGVDVVVAAVAGGPHSPLAARVAHRLAETLGRPGIMACAYRDDDGRSQAVSLIEALHPEVPGIEYRLVRAEDAGDLITGFPERTLLVLGAPGGNWFHRTVYGPGVKLRHRAPNGAVIVRRAPLRVFRVMGDPVFVGPLREASDILRMHGESILAVVDRAVLVGVVRRTALAAAPAGALVSDVMEPPVSVRLDASVEAAAALVDVFGDDPVPVVDEGGLLVGGVLVGPGAQARRAV